MPQKKFSRRRKLMDVMAAEVEIGRRSRFIHLFQTSLLSWFIGFTNNKVEVDEQRRTVSCESFLLSLTSRPTRGQKRRLLTPDDFAPNDAFLNSPGVPRYLRGYYIVRDRHCRDLNREEPTGDANDNLQGEQLGQYFVNMRYRNPPPLLSEEEAKPILMELFQRNPFRFPIVRITTLVKSFRPPKREASGNCRHRTGQLPTDDNSRITILLH
ncbi:unnamed protein product [Caenorhabditis nigoni]